MALPDNHELAIAVNTLTNEVKALKLSHEEHQKCVEELNETFQKGKGALWILTALGAIVTFIVLLAKALKELFT